MPRRTKRRATRPRSKADTQEGNFQSHSALLNLPAELRMLIYTFVAKSNHASISHRGENKGRIITPCPLALVNKHIRTELISALYWHSTVLQTKVVNFDFSHVVTFFNRLSDAELSALPQKGQKFNGKFFYIALKFSPECPARPELLCRWLRRCKKPLKKGADVQIYYDFLDSEMLAKWTNRAEWKRVWLSYWRYTRDEDLRRIVEVVHESDGDFSWDLR